MPFTRISRILTTPGTCVPYSDSRCNTGQQALLSGFFPGRHLAECQVDTWRVAARRLANAVFPVLLRGAAHHQQAAVGQIEAAGGQFARGLVFEVHAPGGAKAERGDDRLRPKFRFVIGVQTHAVVAVTIVIEQYTVEGAAAELLDVLAQPVELRSPCHW